MLKEQHRFFRSVLVVSDLLVIVGSVVLAFHLRFYWLTAWWPVSESLPIFVVHGLPVLAVVPLMLIGMLWSGLYLPRRDQRFTKEAWSIIKAVVMGMLLLMAFLYLFNKVLFDGRDFSRGQQGVFAGVVTAALMVWRLGFRIVLRWGRRRGYNLRHVAIIGTGRLGQVVCRTLLRNSWTGITPGFFISHRENPTHDMCQGLPVHGGLKELERVLDENDLSGVFIALPGKMGANLPDILRRLERYPIDVRVVPDMNPKYLPINMAVHNLEGMPVLSVRESPLRGWGRVQKRLLDIGGALAALLVFALPMLLIAILIRLSSEGSVIFRQRRLSLNGHRFDIYKFRTMVEVKDEPQSPDAEPEIAKWTQRNDQRITPLGRFLRRTSLDELPQIFNVLLGEMSLVGPRPERPELIDRFREDWRGYMLRQNVKAGITGWAQVNGLRGDTSLRKRLQYDLFYIRNWTILFDLRILWMTLFRGFAHPNAH